MEQRMIHCLHYSLQRVQLHNKTCRFELIRNFVLLHNDVCDLHILNLKAPTQQDVTITQFSSSPSPSDIEYPNGYIMNCWWTMLTSGLVKLYKNGIRWTAFLSISWWGKLRKVMNNEFKGLRLIITNSIRLLLKLLLERNRYSISQFIYLIFYC